jgi:hypothetical protein
MMSGTPPPHPLLLPRLPLRLALLNIDITTKKMIMRTIGEMPPLRP